MLRPISTLLVFLITFTLNKYIICTNTTGDLRSLIVIFRHGDRTIVRPYANDPYKNESYWPIGFGQLTNIGKERHLQLGKWLRNRYADFLPSEYNERDVLVRSTDMDRTLMSAEANLAGLYPPTGNQVWDANMNWQPIPIHTTPETQDALLAMKKPCPQYDLLLDELFKSDYFVNISHQNHDLYAYLSHNSGDHIHNLETLNYLYSTLYIETLFNYTIPEWAQKVFPDKMKKWSALSFTTSCYTPELARLKTGPLFTEFVNYFYNRSSSQPDSRRFLIFSAHDTTIANILNTLGAFDVQNPPYASTILLEQRSLNGTSTYINIYYKNSTNEPYKIVPKGCTFDCNLETFKELLKPILVTLEEHEIECNLGWRVVWPLGFAGTLVLIGLIGCVLLMIIGLLARLKYMKKVRENTYTQIPNEEYT